VKSLQRIDFKLFTRALLKLVSIRLFCLMKTSKKRCWARGFFASIKWEKQAGKQSYKCKNCGILFTGSKPSVTKTNQSAISF
jgi:transposase-like protein